MLPKTLLLLASAALAVAGPVKRRDDAAGPGCKPKPPKGATPTLPVSGGPSELPSPPANMVLRHIALGHGIQNYTCDGVSTSATPVAPTAKGALAALYDVTHLYPGQKPDSLSPEAFAALTTQVLWTEELPLNLNQSTVGRVLATALGADRTNPFAPEAPLNLPSVPTLPYIGRHYFDVDNVPTFAINDGGLLRAAKNGSVPVPTGADAGPDGTGAVAWLQLTAVEGSRDLSLVYRVNTAGGNGHACTAVGADSVAYTALYWLYGPK